MTAAPVTTDRTASPAVDRGRLNLPNALTLGRLVAVPVLAVLLLGIELSTTIRLLLGLLRADSGEVRLLGGDPWRDTRRLHGRLARQAQAPLTPRPPVRPGPSTSGHDPAASTRPGRTTP